MTESKNVIQTITVRPAASWQSYSSAEDAVSAGIKDHANTMTDPEVSAAVGSSIDTIGWSENHLALALANGRQLVLRVVPQGIALSGEENLSLELPSSETVLLSFETLSEPIRWDRAAILESREGAIFRGIQLSGQTAFVYTAGNEALMISVLEAVGEGNKVRRILYWGDAD